MNKRFMRFTLSMSRINKMIQKLKLDGMKSFELKGSHTLCIYGLLEHPSGMTSAQIAKYCEFDPGLASRTQKELIQLDIISKTGEPGKYGSIYFLTEKGIKIAREIEKTVTRMQEFVDSDISDEELAIFYHVLDKLEMNFVKLVESSDKFLPNASKSYNFDEVKK